MLRNKSIRYFLTKNWKLKKVMIVLLSLFFLIISFLFISPMIERTRSEYKSSQLKKNTVKEGNTERTDYLDSNGKITIAADLGYATMIVTKKDDIQLEQFYDEQGNPVRRNNGYQAVMREYDEQRNNIRNTYLDSEGNIEITANGYAIEERTYNDKKQLVTVRYYDTEGNPVETPYFGYGIINEYDENGKNTKTTYINASGDPIVTKYGYASIVRSFYVSEGPENGKIENEFYYNAEGEPTTLSLGQYGIHKDYDDYGQESILVYLDKNGNPIITNKGFTSVVRTYQANNAVATERYYDIEGSPFSLSEGRYGTKKENGQTIYLDQNGKEIFNVRTILYNQTWIVIPLSVLLLIVSTLITRRWNTIIFLIYIYMIMYLTLMFRNGESVKRVGFFWYYKDVFISDEARADILKNIWLFIPLGGILYQLYPKKIVLLIPIALSMVIEVIQYSTGAGFCELDDVISNGLGGWIGFMAGKLLTNVKLFFLHKSHIQINKEGFDV